MQPLHEIEQAVLACMVSSPRAAARVCEILEPTDFAHDDHRTIYSMMVEMVEDGRRIDQLTLTAELRKATFEAEVLGVAQSLYSVASQLASVDHADEYALVVREEAVRRVLTRHVDRELAKKADLDVVVSGVEAAVYAARSRMQGEGEVNEYSGASIMSPLDSFLSGTKASDGLPYPFPYLTRNYGVFERGTYSILAGYSGDGKTTVAVQWLEEMCEAGAKVCLREIEMSGLGISRMLATQGAGITTRQAKGLDPMSLEEVERYDLRKKQVSSWDLVVKTGAATPSQIRADQVRERYDAIIVDHMQKFERTSDGEYADITRYSSQLHRITRDLGASVIVLSQLKTRADGTRPQPTPDLLRGTRSMEEDADSVMFVWRDRNAAGRRSLEAKFIIAKMREGASDKGFSITLDTDRVKYFETGEARPDRPSLLARRVQEVEA